MKYCAVLAVLATAVVADSGQELQNTFLMNMGFPQCAVDCINAGSKAAFEVGCAQTDSSCSCPGGKGADASNAAVAQCLATATCTPDQVAMIQPASAKICGGQKGQAAATTAKPASNSTVSLTGKPSAGATSTSKGGASPQNTFAAGVLGMAGLAAVLMV